MASKQQLIQAVSEPRQRLALTAACMLYPDICITIESTLRHVDCIVDHRLLITDPFNVTDMRNSLDFMSAESQQQILMDLLQHPRARFYFTNILKNLPMPLNKLNRPSLARL